ncbi:WXG100 family type VII secretion target [Streptomyces sp. NBC_00829]|uniref:WXG100 family type VII secretion target n=1 Tax=Streptomyces sp. NBC_00829 TaxID=2903679 RepID=UPI0038643331|nr:WXG100 family type VII secretion target [Streptomyces sp. NBC_00829]
MADSGQADYDVSVIDVSPRGMNTTAAQVKNLAQDVSDSLGLISTTLGGLRIAWQGKAASEADEVAREWLRVITELFGTKEDPSKGVLPTLANGVGMASGNFSKAEDGIVRLFTDFRNALTSGGGEGDPPKDTPPEEVTDTNKTAVTMTFPG